MIITHHIPKEDVPIIVRLGIFKNNELHLEDGSSMVCITYKSHRQMIEGRIGYHNMMKVDGIKEWVIFQSILLDE